MDPDGGDERHRQARTERRVTLVPFEDGMAALMACLTAPDAHTCYGWLTALARGLGRADPRGMDARRADLLVDLLTGRLTIVTPDTTSADTTSADTITAPTSSSDTSGRTATSDPTTTPDAITPDAITPDATDADADDADDDVNLAVSARAAGQPATPPGAAPGAPPWRPAPVAPGKPLVQIIVPFTTLAGAGDDPVELVGYGPIPPAMARTIAADAVWKRLVTDPLSGILLDHGRSTYRPPAGLADWVRARDQTCRFPPCNRRAIDIDLDHTIAHGGTTTDGNLHGGCPHHHHLKHDAPGWTVTQTGEGLITWTTPTGHRYTSRPYDYRPEPDPVAPTPRLRKDPAPVRPTLPDPWTRPPGTDDAPF